MTRREKIVILGLVCAAASWSYYVSSGVWYALLVALPASALVVAALVGSWQAWSSVQRRYARPEWSSVLVAVYRCGDKVIVEETSMFRGLVMPVKTLHKEQSDAELRRMSRHFLEQGTGGFPGNGITFRGQTEFEWCGLRTKCVEWDLDPQTLWAAELSVPKRYRIVQGAIAWASGSILSPFARHVLLVCHRARRTTEETQEHVHSGTAAWQTDEAVGSCGIGVLALPVIVGGWH